MLGHKKQLSAGDRILLFYLLLITTKWSNLLRMSNTASPKRFMHIGCEIVQGGMTNRPFHSLASIESEGLVDERMILFRQMGESPDPSCIFGKDCAIR